MWCRVEISFLLLKCAVDEIEITHSFTFAFIQHFSVIYAFI